MKTLRPKLIGTICLGCVVFFGIFFFSIKYNDYFQSFFLESCPTLTQADIQELNVFFKNTQYHGDLKYWCKMTQISTRVSLFQRKIPPEIGKLVNLQTINLEETGLVGQIPKEIGELTNLKFLFLNHNNLDGVIPKEIGDLKNLIGLNLQGNQISGTIPVELGNLTHLQSLNLSDNHLTGKIPTQFGNLKELKLFFLKDNQIQEGLPQEILQLPKLEMIDNMPITR